MKREKELEEMRKNEPQLADDYLVRKLFSRFRRITDKSAPQLNGLNGGDAEKGLIKEDAAHDVIIGCEQNSDTTMIELNNLSENNARVKDNSNSTSIEIAENALRGADDIHSKIEAIVESSSLPVVAKPASKWGKLLSKPPAIKLELAETPNTTPTKSTQSRVLTSVRSLKNLRSPTNDSTSETSQDGIVHVGRPHDASPAISSYIQLDTATHQQLVSDLCNIRHELKDEMNSMTTKLMQIDDRLKRLMQLLPLNLPGLGIGVGSNCNSNLPTPSWTSSIQHIDDDASTGAVTPPNKTSIVRSQSAGADEDVALTGNKKLNEKGTTKAKLLVATEKKSLANILKRAHFSSSVSAPAGTNSSSVNTEIPLAVPLFHFPSSSDDDAACCDGQCDTDDLVPKLKSPSCTHVDYNVTAPNEMNQNLPIDFVDSSAIQQERLPLHGETSRLTSCDVCMNTFAGDVYHLEGEDVESVTVL